VLRFAAANAATPYDVPGVDYSHDGAACSFDAFIRRHRIRAAGPPQGANCSPVGGSAAATAASVGDPAFGDAALDMLATIVRGADTAVLDLAPQAPGLLAISLGLSQMFADDHAMLRYGMLVYDAMYAWCRQATQEKHGWNPAALRKAATAA
jgi:hypothetical protein